MVYLSLLYLYHDHSHIRQHCIQIMTSRYFQLLIQASMPSPFHMQDVPDNLPILPKGTSTPDAHHDSEATFVELGSIQMNPNTGSIFRPTNSIHLFTPSFLSAEYAEYKSTGTGLSSFARITDDGRIVISLDLKKKLPDLPKEYSKEVKEFAVDNSGWRDVPRMNVVIMIVGSRGRNFNFNFH
jgi:sterol 3beta-glucosyltransferase